MLQEVLTPHDDELKEKRYGDRVFRVGDKVIQLRNNYTKGKAGIFNGTVGTVTGLSLQEQILTVLTALCAASGYLLWGTVTTRFDCPTHRDAAHKRPHPPGARKRARLR